MKKELLIPYAKGVKFRKKEPTNIQELEKNMYALKNLFNIS